MTRDEIVKEAAEKIAAHCGVGHPKGASGAVPPIVRAAIVKAGYGIAAETLREVERYLKDQYRLAIESECRQAASWIHGNLCDVQRRIAKEEAKASGTCPDCAGRGSRGYGPTFSTCTTCHGKGKA